MTSLEKDARNQFTFSEDMNAVTVPCNLISEGVWHYAKDDIMP